MRHIITLTFSILMLCATQTQAAESGCVYEGKVYPEGTEIGPYICQTGKWVVL
ncbi:MAG: hypothetical protein ACI82Q_002682 [Nonlabens sp.]|jgi:hypothetical protein